MADRRISQSELIASFAASIEAEQQRISRLLHDELGPTLTSAGLQLDALRLEFGRGAPQLIEGTRDIQRLLDRAIDRIRDLSYELDPSVGERAGLFHAMERLAQRMQRRTPPISVNFASNAIGLKPGMAGYLFRLSQFSVRYAEHSGAKNISVSIRDLGRAYLLEVLYDVSSPAEMTAATVRAEASLALLRHHASIRGVSVVVERREDGSAIVRARCRKKHGADDDHAPRGPAGR